MKPLPSPGPSAPALLSPVMAGASGTSVPPNPFLANAVADTIGAFSEIVNAEVFYPFRGGSGWGEVVSADAGSSSPRGPLAGPKF